MTTSKTTNPDLKSKKRETEGERKAQQIAETGLESRVKGHISARERRAQGRKDHRE